MRDRKDYPLLAITREEFPQVFITRDRELTGVDFIGPFTSATDLRQAYHFLMRVFQFRSCDLKIRSDDNDGVIYSLFELSHQTLFGANGENKYQSLSAGHSGFAQFYRGEELLRCGKALRTDAGRF